MRLQLTTSLAILATASTVVADDVVSVLWPSSASGENYNAKLIGTVRLLQTPLLPTIVCFFRSNSQLDRRQPHHSGHQLPGDSQRLRDQRSRCHRRNHQRRRRQACYHRLQL